MNSRYSTLWNKAPKGVVSRRSLLRIAGGVTLATGGGLLLPRLEAQAATKGLTMFTWQGYDLTKSFEKWRAERGIEQTVKYVANQFDVASILKGPGGTDYDISTANQAYTKLFQQLGLSSPISAKDVPSMAKMYTYLRESPIWKTAPGSDTWNYVPWTWGAVGINYLTDKVDPPTSWHDLLDPKHKGRVATYDDAFNNVSIAAIALGIDLTKISKAALAGPIRDWLLKFKPNLKSISGNLGDMQSLLVNKEVDLMCVGLTLFVTGGKAQGANNIGFVLPKEGGFGYVDAAFITPWAPNRENANAFCEALLSGETAAAAANEFAQGVAVPDVVPLLNADTRSLYPYDGDIDNYIANEIKLQVNFTPQPGEDIVSFDEINVLWQEVKAS